MAQAVAGGWQRAQRFPTLHSIQSGQAYFCSLISLWLLAKVRGSELMKLLKAQLLRLNFSVVTPENGLENVTESLQLSTRWIWSPSQISQQQQHPEEMTHGELEFGPGPQGSRILFQCAVKPSTSLVTLPHHAAAAVLAYLNTTIKKNRLYFPTVADSVWPQTSCWFSVWASCSTLDVVSTLLLIWRSSWIWTVPQNTCPRLSYSLWCHWGMEKPLCRKALWDKVPL